MKRVVITGGAGFIGSHVADEFRGHGYEVVVVDNLSSGRETHVADGVTLVRADIRDVDWDEVLRADDIVVHCAAFVNAPESLYKFDECLTTNVSAMWRLLEACKNAEIAKFLFCSSSAIYGDEPRRPKPESEYPNPANPYGLTKLDGEHLLAMAQDLWSLPYVAFRYFNVYGPRQDASSPYSGVIPLFITAALAGQTLTIYGDGSQSRDFVFVRDVARCIRAYAEHHAVGVYNVGTGTEQTVTALAETIVELCGSQSNICYAPVREGDAAYSTADLSRQLAEGIWQADVAFADGLAETITYYR